MIVFSGCAQVSGIGNDTIRSLNLGIASARWLLVTPLTAPLFARCQTASAQSSSGEVIRLPQVCIPGLWSAGSGAARLRSMLALDEREPCRPDCFTRNDSPLFCYRLAPSSSVQRRSLDRRFDDPVHARGSLESCRFRSHGVVRCLRGRA